jgi:adenosine deaminase
MRLFSRTVIAGLLLLPALLAACGDATSPEQRMSDRVAALRNDPEALGELLRSMPKGADLHSHLTGAARTESLIDWGIAADLCVDDRSLSSSNPPCVSGQVPMRDAEVDPELYGRILAAWSMEGFEGPLLRRHEHFFDTFGKFGAATSNRVVDILVEQRREALDESLLYLELMSSWGSSSVSALGTEYLPPDDPWSPAYLRERREALLADARFTAALESGASFLADTFAGVDQTLGCDGVDPDPACEVELLVQCNGTRTLPRGAVFAQFLYCFELAQRDPRVVGVNLVAPEENPSSLAFYDDEMLAAGTLRDLYASTSGLRPVGLALHAGELVPEILPDTPEGQAELTFHIRRAVEVATADRIGHGSDLRWEDEGPGETPETLLATMRARGVLVEICLTSSEVVLGLEGTAHPLATYLAHDVPVALATDDEGVLRTDLVHEYVRAVTRQDVDYSTLKRLTRNSLEYAFLPGSSLWAERGRYRALSAPCEGARPGAGDPTSACASFLAENLRASLQWRLEERLVRFEETDRG